MKRAILFILPFLLLGACTQEHFIFVRNLKTAKLLTMEQVLRDSGLALATSTTSTTSTTLPPLRFNPNPTTTTTVPVVSKYLDIPANEEFSINIYEPNKFIVLKKVTGNLTLLSNRSDPDNGFFLFRNGVVNSQAVFYIHGLAGNLQKIIVYKINIPPANGAQSAQTAQSNNLRSLITNGSSAQNQQVQANIANAIIASLHGLSMSEQIKTLSNNIAAPDVPQADKDALRYKLLDIYIDQRSFSLADPQIAAIRDPAYKALYQARYNWRKSQYVTSMRYYLQAVDGADPVKRSAVSELAKMLIEYGNVEQTVVNKLRAETEKYKDTDPEFYGRTMLDIGRLYEFLKDVYESEKIYQSVLNGNYSAETKRLADLYYAELKNNFLFYR